MANPGLTIEQMREAIYAFHKNGGNKAAAARELKLNYNTYEGRFNTAMRKAEIIAADDEGIATFWFLKHHVCILLLVSVQTLTAKDCAVSQSVTRTTAHA